MAHGPLTPIIGLRLLAPRRRLRRRGSGGRKLRAPRSGCFRRTRPSTSSELPVRADLLRDRSHVPPNLLVCRAALGTPPSPAEEESHGVASRQLRQSLRTAGVLEELEIRECPRSLGQRIGAPVGPT